MKLTVPFKAKLKNWTLGDLDGTADKECLGDADQRKSWTNQSLSLDGGIELGEQESLSRSLQAKLPQLPFSKILKLDDPCESYL